MNQTATLHLSTNRFGEKSRSVEFQQHARIKPQDEKFQVSQLIITVPDHLTLLSRNEVNNGTGESGSDTLAAN